MKRNCDRVDLRLAITAGANPVMMGYTPMTIVPVRGDASTVYMRGTPYVTRTNRGLLVHHAEGTLLCLAAWSMDPIVVKVAANADHPVDVATDPGSQSWGSTISCRHVDLTCPVSGLADPRSAYHWYKWKAAIRKRVSAPVKPPCRKALVAMRTKRMNEKAKRRDEGAVQAFIAWCSDAKGSPKASACMNRLNVWNTIDEMFKAARARPRHWTDVMARSRALQIA